MQTSVDGERLAGATADPQFWAGLAAAMAGALVRSHKGNAAAAPRQIVRLPHGDGFGAMAGIDSAESGSVVGVKLVTLPRERLPDGPSHPGSVILIHPATGRVRALFDADLVTQLRTAATTAAVTLALRPGATSLAVLGTGTEARTHLQALRASFPSARLVLWGRRPEAASALASALNAEGCSVEVRADLRAAVAEADVITSVTAARAPFVGRDLISADVLVNAVGASVPGLREWHRNLFEAAALVLCDDVDECGRQSDEVPESVLRGAVNVGDILGGASEPAAPDGITVYKSVGTAVLDVAAARFLLDVGA